MTDPTPTPVPAPARVIARDGWTLHHDDTGEPVCYDDVVLDHRDGYAYVRDGRPPHKPSSTGKVWTSAGVFYPRAYGLTWKRD